MYQNQFSLLNSSLAPIEFDLKLSEPFFLANEMNKSKRIQLKPKSKTKVTKQEFMKKKFELNELFFCRLMSISN